MICGVRLAICLPTYNERESLEPIVRALDDVFARNGLDGRVLVLDDASPDGTGVLADRLAAELPWLDVVHRPRKDGLGPAYLAGFERVLAEGAELVMEMDCDFSHDPADVPRLVAATADADLVIGSRYVPGGGVRNWGPVRRAVSRSGCLYAQAILALPVRDATAGFRCFRRRVLEAIGLERVTSRGYAFQVETTYRVVRAGFRVVEVPIVFAERKAGSSKMTRGIVAEAVVKVPALRLAAALGRL
ncbi:MAG: polyprenol monophosphomannose synthase [Thermoleophilia bacterium]|nr:polyprenol monophosphomannose synthase [Thermoleophilia bacterium]MDQ3859220.1 polyprenol monophosphomannose synthase [Actinomycetota bacterium]